jgi:hypothetical protein
MLMIFALAFSRAQHLEREANIEAESKNFLTIKVDPPVESKKNPAFAGLGSSDL